MSESPRGSHHSIEQNAGSSSTTTGIPRSQSTIQKSMIPKYRSLSQPSSAMLLDEGKLNEAKAENLIAEKLLEDNSGLVDEFKDCLDSVKLDLDLDSNSTTALDDIKISSETTEDILYILPLEKEGSREEIKKVQSSLPSTPTSTSKYARKVVPRKNSSSGIPVSLSIPKSTPKSIPISKSSITKPRNVPAVSPSAKKQPPPPTNTSAHTTNEPASKRNVSPMNSSKRIHELFATKKKRYETLRKEVVDKQKPVLEMYTSLQKLKKKLEESGQNVVLEPMRILDFDGMPKEVKSSTGTTPSRPETADNSFEGGAGEQLGKLNVTQEAVTQIKKTISGIQTTTCQICKELIEGRQELLRQLRRLCDSDKCKEEIGHELEMRKIEGENLENSLKVALKEQEKEVEDLIAGWSQIAESGDQEKVDEYKTKIASLEQKLKEVTSELNNAQEKVVNDSAPETEELRADNGKLKQRISTLEKQLETERKKTQSEAEKYKTAENALKSYKSKLKDVDTTKQQHDSKISQLTQELRSAQTKIKVMERNYEKEIAELNKSRNLDKTVIERLNKDKSTFETRIRVANQQIETLREENLVRECKLREDAVNAKKDLEIQENYVGQLKTEIEKLKHELLEVQTYAKQTSEVLRKKSDMKGAVGPITEKECELQIEVVAQRAAIKSLQEKIDANTKEKLRFIETIERMNGQPDQINQDIVKTLVMREEDITHLHQILKKREDEITTWKLESQTLQAKLDHLTAQIEAMQTENGSHDLKNMLREGKTKLEQALMKSLENEHKLIKYEHELTQKSQAVSNMENMLKVRDGIVSVLKAKKVELEMENKSLAKYSEEIRNYVLETKEELKEKNDIIKQLQSALETKTREWQKFERQVEELEDKLASTNEKRYKLQDTVSLMERELQATKADVQTRYDDDMKAPGREINFSGAKDEGSVKIKITVS